MKFYILIKQSVAKSKEKEGERKRGGRKEGGEGSESELIKTIFIWRFFSVPATFWLFTVIYDAPNFFLLFLVLIALKKKKLMTKQ